MTPDAIAADNTSLTIEQAVAELDATDTREQEAPAQAEQPQTQNAEAEPAAEDASEPETATDGENAEQKDGAEEAEEAELPAIEPPRFWDAEAKNRFRELPRDLQELVLAKEDARDKATARAMQEAAEKRKAADGEASRIAQLNGVLDKLIPQAEQTFKSRWEGVDWNAVVDQYGAEQALKLRNQYESEQAHLQQLQTAKKEAEQVQYQRFVEAEAARLPELCPDLADPKFGPQRKAELGKFLIENGVPADTLRNISALETSIAYDAMRWRQAQAKATQQAASPKTPAKPAAAPKPSVRATAAPARAGSPQQQRLQALSKKSTLSIDEAVELLNLQET